MRRCTVVLAYIPRNVSLDPKAFFEMVEDSVASLGQYMNPRCALRLLAEGDLLRVAELLLDSHC